MTNGEKLKEVFPNMRIDVFVSYVQVVGENYEFNNLYPLKWWNAEYKEPTTKNDVPDNNVGKIGSITKNNSAVDAVRRKAVLNTLDNMDSALDDEDRTVETYKKLLKECYKVLPSVTPQEPRWIPVSERLPEELWGVLVYCPTNDNIFCAYLEKGVWKIFSPEALEEIKEIVTAWMPLPQPYKGVEE